MANKKQNQLTASSEWAKHLRKIGKRIFWKGERLAEKKMIYDETQVIESIERNTHTEILQRLATIAEKLLELKNLDTQFKVFGSEHHQYKFNAAITLNEVVEFEKQHNISLPSDYREFLLTFGNGGCGPNYGLLSLQKGAFELPQNISQSNIIELAKPFRFTSYWNINHIEGELEHQENEYDESKWCNGMLRICHEGCGYFVNLVLNSNERGNLWIDGRVSEAGIFPLNYYENNQPISFSNWYLRWLEHSIDEIKNANV